MPWNGMARAGWHGIAMEWNGMDMRGMKLNGIEWNGQDGVESNEIEWNVTVRNGIDRIGSACSVAKNIAITLDELECAGIA